MFKKLTSNILSKVSTSHQSSTRLFEKLDWGLGQKILDVAQKLLHNDKGHDDHKKQDHSDHHDETHTAETSAEGVEIQGGSGEDVLIGGAGNDRILGGQSDDILIGGGGDDYLHGSTENDLIFGGKGNDDLHGGSDNDTIFGGKGDDNVISGPGDDIVFGGKGDDFLRGNNDNDIVFGGRGDDALMGDAGNDKLYGGLGDDHLIGNSGDDILYGGFGNDILDGGSGNDIYVFKSRYEGVDSIVDFRHDGYQKDAIDISKLLRGYDPVTDAIENFVRVTCDAEAGGSTIAVNDNGRGNDFHDIVKLNIDYSSDAVTDLVSSGILIV